ncbi:MAG: hypothetical protein KIT14_25535 [bacterium]|nr:hypothetical protein [bacterium]
MIGFLLALALLAALVATGVRRGRRVARERAAARAPGASIERAVAVTSFDEMDLVLARRRCPCGGAYALQGEGTRDAEERRYRVARLECRTCESTTAVFFDVTALRH